MSHNRVENSRRNLVWGFMYRGIFILFPFVIRTIIVQILGAEYLGLNNLFTSILQVLNITELGFGSAIAYSLYGPVARKDIVKIQALMRFYRNIYRVIGVSILLIGVCLLPFLHDLISGSYPQGINIYLVYLIQLSATVLSYLLFSYKSILLVVHQRNDIKSKINGAVLILQYLAQIAALVIFNNYYVYVSILVLSTILNNLIVGAMVDKRYPEYYAEGKIDKEMRKMLRIKVRGLLINRLCQETRNSFDSIFLSTFLGLNIVAIYNNYYSILYALINLTSVVTTSILSSVGNSIAVESSKKNYQDMMKFNFIYMILAGWATVFLVNLIQPFMGLWMGEDMLLSSGTTMLLCAYYYALNIGVIRAVYSDAAGLWWENRYRAIAETVANVVLNFILGKILGVNGIILATLISLLVINFGFGSLIIFKHYFKKERALEFYRAHLIYALVTCLIVAVTYLICDNIAIGNLVLKIIFNGVVCVIVPAVCYYLCYCRTKHFHEAKSFFKKTIKRSC